LLFAGEPAGILTIRCLADALEQIAELRQRLDDLEGQLGEMHK
jgi:hypothetical protein